MLESVRQVSKTPYKKEIYFYYERGKGEKEIFPLEKEKEILPSENGIPPQEKEIFPSENEKEIFPSENEIFPQENEREESGNDYQRIRRYSKHFGLHGDKLRDFISNYRFGDTLGEKKRAILKKIKEIESKCLEKAFLAGVPLKDYQKKAFQFMLKERGMIAAFDMGTGKTLTAVAISYSFILLSHFFRIRNYHVIVVTPLSLIERFRQEMKLFGINENSMIYKFYTPESFTQSYNNGTIPIRKSLLIIDESHCMRTDYRCAFEKYYNKNRVKKHGRAATAVKCGAKASKVLLLTGTPLYNNTVDIVNLTAMVKGKKHPSRDDPYTLIQKDPDHFQRYYKNIFMFHSGFSHEYPERKDIIMCIIMNREFLKKYEEIEDKVEIVRTRSGREKERKVKNSFMSKMRCASNSIEPSLKCQILLKIVEDALSRREKVLIFTDFIEAGIDIISRKLSSRGIVYRAITGKTKPITRKNIVTMYNRDEILVLLISSAGGEGLDLKGVRHVIPYEKNWNIARMEQYIRRAIRMGSHALLSPKKKNVRVWHLLLVKPCDYSKGLPSTILSFGEIEYIGIENKNLKCNGKESADLRMFRKALEKEEKIQVVMNELKNIQIS